MKQKIFTLFTLLALCNLKAQITPSISIPDGIANYDGTYDNIGQGHLFYPNAGEIRLDDKDRSSAIDVVKYYTMYTNPKQYLMYDNNISLCYDKNDPASLTGSVLDTLQRIDVEWQGSNPSAFLARVDTQKFARLFYFDQYFASSGGRTVEGGAAIACQSIYDNIDLVYTSNNAGLVMYFIVYPGGNYKDIFLHFNGSNSSSIVSNKLIAQGSWDSFILQKPKMYQYSISSGVVTPVTICNANWVNTGTDTYQINNSTLYNTSLPLIIQIKQNDVVSMDTPGLCWSTYFGGVQYEFMTKTHTDANDNLYVAGSSNSSGNTFPQNLGLSGISPLGNDGAISKFNSTGQLQWSTFVGGTANENIRDFDFSGNSVFCVGRTASNGSGSTVSFPTISKTGAFNDGSFGGGTAPWDGFIFEFEFDIFTNQFVTKWATFFGGNDWDDLYGCKIDASGNLYIVGASSSSDMSIQALTGGYLQNFNTAQLNSSTPISTDAIIGKFTSGGAISWFTFFGTDLVSGTNAYTHAADYFYGVTLAGSNVYACGKSGGTNLPSSVNSKFVSGQFDGILANFTTNGALTASKYTDGNIANYAVGERWGDVYTVGEANSSMTPANSGLWYYSGTAPGGPTDACFSIHTTNLSATTTHNSFLGGSDEDGANDLQFSANNLLLISGGTRSSNFPVTSLGSMYSSSFAGGVNDNFIAAFQKGNTNITWSSCLGSNFNESQTIPPFINTGFDWANSTISIDSQNTLRLLGSTTSFNTFPPDDGGGVPYFQSTSGGPGNDATITCFDMADLNSIVGLKDFPNTQFSYGLYPNPTSKNLSITNSTVANDDLRYAIYDASGKKLQAGTLKSSDAKNIDVSMLQQGIYIINVSNGKITYSNKFVKVAD
jgi:hypothetical protein